MMKGAKKAWELRQSEGEIKVARITGKSGTVFVPLTAAQAGRPTVRIRAFSADKRPLSVRVNDNKDINGKLDGGLVDARAHRSRRPAQGRRELDRAVREGRGVEVAWMQVGAHDAGRRRRRDEVLRRRAARPHAAEGRRPDLVRRDPRQGQAHRRSRRRRVHDQRPRDRRRRHDVPRASSSASARPSISRRCRARRRASSSTRSRLRPGRSSRTPRSSSPATSPAVKRGEPPKYVVFVDHGLAARRSRALFNPKARARDARTGKSSPKPRRCSSTTTCRATSRRSRTRRCGRRTTSPSTRRSRCRTSSPTSR